MATGLPRIRVGESLETFIDRELRSSEQYKSRMHIAVDCIVKHLHRLPNYSVKEVVKSGSLGKGTTIENDADADLVVFFNGYSNIEELIAAKERIISDISTYMDKFDRTKFTACIKVRSNEYLGTYKLKHVSGAWVEVDVLPALDVVGMFGSVEGVYDDMRYKTTQVRSHYSVCFCKEQKKLIRCKSAKVKDLIRLLKFWKKENGLDMKSYCCEIICLHVHNTKLRGRTNCKMNERFKEVLNFLIDTQTPHTVIEPKFYFNTREWFTVFPSLQEGAQIRQLAKKTKAALG